MQYILMCIWRIWNFVGNLSLGRYLLILNSFVVLIFMTAFFFVWHSSEYSTDGIGKNFLLFIALLWINYFTVLRNPSLANQFVWLSIERSLSICLVALFASHISFFSLIFAIPIVIHHQQMNLTRDLFEKQFSHKMDTKLRDCFSVPHTPDKPPSS